MRRKKAEGALTLEDREFRSLEVKWSPTGKSVVFCEGGYKDAPLSVNRKRLYKRIAYERWLL